MPRGRMKQKTKDELREELRLAQEREAALRDELAALREGVLGAASDAPIVVVVGLSETFEPFMEAVRPVPVPAFAMDAMAAHLSRMSAASSHREVDDVGPRVTQTETHIRELYKRIGELSEGQQKTMESLGGLSALIRSIVDGRELGIFGGEEQQTSTTVGP